MGTFHSGKGDLHGITVVVHTHGERTYVGRCDTVDAEGVHLLDADVHEEGSEGGDRHEWLTRAARVGVWPRHAHLLVPADDVAGIRRLGDLASR